MTTEVQCGTGSCIGSTSMGRASGGRRSLGTHKALRSGPSNASPRLSATHPPRLQRDEANGKPHQAADQRWRFRLLRSSKSHRHPLGPRCAAQGLSRRDQSALRLGASQCSLHEGPLSGRNSSHGTADVGAPRGGLRRSLDPARRNAGGDRSSRTSRDHWPRPSATAVLLARLPGSPASRPLDTPGPNREPTDRVRSSRLGEGSHSDREEI